MSEATHSGAPDTGGADTQVFEVKDFVCTQCPWGCALQVSLNANGEVVLVEGNSCPRGEKYGRAEATTPMRVLTTLVDCADEGFGPASVKTEDAISKALIDPALEVAHGARVSSDVEMGTVVVEDIAGSGVNLVVTRPPSKLFLL